ncbi:hypothetical protein [Streptomyces sp. NPDC001604]|uniref:hypothetical protein n=1 Tax=Streptomyces sp. NPDC001604 TaxID=3364593 RepID=UPI0036B5D066
MDVDRREGAAVVVALQEVGGSGLVEKKAVGAFRVLGGAGRELGGGQDDVVDAVLGQPSSCRASAR